MFSIVMIALGSFRFGLSSANYQSFTRTASYRWRKVDRVGIFPAMQYAGPDTQEITIEGVIYPHYKGGLRQMDKMRTQAYIGLPMMMVDGLGYVWQRWVIVRVEEKKTYLMADGAPRKIDFSITLKSYGGGVL